MPDERPEITVTLEDGERRGRYVGKVAGVDAEGEITFTHRGPDLISADHTGAPDELRGTGLAAAMVEYLVADARARGFKVIPICPYVRARYEQHPEWRDVFTVGPGEKPKLTAAQFRGRELFAVSRRKRKSTNDADRLRKYLARFSLGWDDIH